MPPLKVEEFGERLVTLFPRLMREIARYEQNYLTEGKITPRQFLVLDHLCKQGPSQMSDLAEIMDLQCSSMTGLVDRLIRGKMVHRDRSEDDRRVVSVSITKKGENVVREIHDQKKKGVIGLFSRLNASERQTYLDILEKLVHGLSVNPAEKENV